ncbi:Endoribonuclease Dcr-1 [Orchesella cincta]|uniref:ribonuclease III n=1 Tax=Orchesella cincta TaxID=48709 RepID=A0A1D2NAK8_ORCCI|nr:Endoribonuclease Dcr-1 [Orchesella cincta]
MEETFKRLETLCCAKVDTTSDVVALLRYSTTPKERIVQFTPGYLEDVAERLTLRIKEIIEPVKDFLERHTFDALASYGFDNGVSTAALEDNEESDSLIQELRKIPHPKTEPLQVLEQFLQVLNTFGPWCAYRSLILLIHLVEKLKVRTPYERHYLLLGALHTRFAVVQKTLLSEFTKYEPIEALERFSTPKLRAVLDVLRRFDLTHPVEPIRPKRQEEKVDDDEDGDESFDHGDSLGTEEEKRSMKSGKQKKNVKFDNKNKRGGGRGGRRRQPGKRIDENQQQEQNKESSEIPLKEVENGEKEIIKDIVEVEVIQTEDAKVIEEIKVVEEKKEPTTDENACDSIIPPPPVKVENEQEAPAPIEPNTNTDQNPKKTHRRRPTGHRGRFTKKTKIFQRVDESSLCAIIFVENRFDARLLFHFLKEASFSDRRLVGLNPTIAIDPNPEYAKDSREAEMEHKRREECLKKFRYREANVLIGTSLLEEGIELPKANLVVRFDPAKSFRSYLFSKGRAQGFDAELQRPQAFQPSQKAEQVWDSQFPRFKSAKLSNAISVVNRYCARLPSDTFTRLVPLWYMESLEAGDKQKCFSCCLRLPINSPVKWTIKGVPMPTESLAKQAVALQTVVILHSNGELDDTLMPIGKEGVRQEPDLYDGDDSVDDDCGEFRPGSTKRRQYYNKQLAAELSQCLPKPDTPVYLYWIRMVLTCPLPDEQNTRGRKLHPPENASQSFGIMLAKPIPPLPPFPIYTRCGEVQVQLVRVVNEENLLTGDNIEKISAFHHYTFTSVLRLDKYLTLFDPTLSENSYYVIPLKRVQYSNSEFDTLDDTVSVDWNFIDLIWSAKDVPRPKPQTDEDRKDYKFKAEEYTDAVVMPWYRNHDVPQYFYVAEICENLTPRSQFPGCEFKTFEEYYNKKYSISIQDADQPLLDVDHTSARLNFLTPRYVNRKGMALPTSSESTKKAKRENLEQKQILVPELCAIHPFTASLWRQAVCLPCILYRMNCILLANNIRITVASQVHGLGKPVLPTEFIWEPLSFGWTLSDVVACNLPAIENESPAAAEDCSKKEESSEDAETKCNGIHSDEDSKAKENGESNGSKSENEGETPPDEHEEELSGFAKAAKEAPSPHISLAESLLMNEQLVGKSANEILSEEMKKCRPPTLEIGMWTNEMASETLANELDFDDDDDELLMDPTVALPSNLMMLDKNWTWGGRSRLFNHRVHRALYGSPTHWGEVWDMDAFVPIEDLEDANANMDADNMSVTSDMSGSDESFLDEENNFKIQFHNGNTAEALDKRKLGTAFDRRVRDEWAADEDMWWQMDDIDDDFPSKETESPTVNGHADDEDHKSDLSPYLKEDKLRKSFEQRVEENMRRLDRVIEWNAVKDLEPRRQKKTDDGDATSGNQASSQYDEIFKKLTSTKPPELFPESEQYKNSRSQKVQLRDNDKSFSFDYQPSLNQHVGPSPCQILQALTMSNANDGLNLERLETIGDSFLKYAITSYLFCTFENIHEGKLSHLRSKQVSNVHLYRLGRRRGLGGVMVATKFEPHDNWLPPAYHIPKELDKAFQSKRSPFTDQSKIWRSITQNNADLTGKTEVIPYNLVTQQSIPDKSIADSVEALIGAYLTSMGPLGALLFMSWLGIRVLPSRLVNKDEVENVKRSIETEKTRDQPVFYMQPPDSQNLILFANLQPPNSPLLRYSKDCEIQLNTLLKGYDQFEESVGYKFRDRSYLLQAFTHASYTPNNLTDCYQRLEFLGDAILDYLITRHLYEDPLQHSPGSLTDLRSALVNNTIFASLAVKNGFHKYFRHCSPGLAGVLQKFVAFQEQHGHTLTQDYYLMDEEECEEAEDIEVPKALGDVFESVAGAIFLDSGMSLDAVWDVYYRIMKREIEEFSKNVPKSPIRELLELEPETAKFGKPEKLWDGRRVRVSVDIFGVGTFRGIGRNYRIAKCTAAKCALRHVRKIRQTQGSRR